MINNILYVICLLYVIHPYTTKHRLEEVLSKTVFSDVKIETMLRTWQPSPRVTTKEFDSTTFKWTCNWERPILFAIFNWLKFWHGLFRMTRGPLRFVNLLFGQDLSYYRPIELYNDKKVQVSKRYPFYHDTITKTIYASKIYTII